MTTWDKLIASITALDKNMRFEELRKILESFGYEMRRPSGGSSHCTFCKPGCAPITIPVHEPIKVIYVMIVREIIEREANPNEND